MDDRRRLIRLEVGDFLEIRPLNEVGVCHKAKVKDLTPMGICFSSEIEWHKGQVLVIDYFIPQELDSVKVKMVVIWSEFIDSKKGYFCGGEILEVEEGKHDLFTNYYHSRLKDRFS